MVVTVISGVTNLTVTMTVLQITAWLVFLALVLPAFIRATRTRRPSPPTRPRLTPNPAAGSGCWPDMWPDGRRPGSGANRDRGSDHRRHPAEHDRPTSQCRSPATPAPRNGRPRAAGFWRHSRFRTSPARSARISLVNGAGGVVGEIETIGPGTTAGNDGHTRGRGHLQVLPVRPVRHVIRGGPGHQCGIDIIHGTSRCRSRS